MCAELEKEEEEGYGQSAHQDVMEEPRVGACSTRRKTGEPWTHLQGLLSSRPWQRGAPFLSWFVPEPTKMTGFSPINWARARSLAWSESE